jgi:murein DD-endopeptidase MepM/ murein hydrolase activator NlpD
MQNKVGFGAMKSTRAAPVRHWVERTFPERHLYLRSGGETRGYILTTGKQVMLATAGCLLGAWLILATASTIFTLFLETNAQAEVRRVTNKYERLMADRSARLDNAVAKLNETSSDELARTIERRHRALQMVFAGVPGSDPSLQASTTLDPKKFSPVERILAVRFDQERMIARAEGYAKTRAERLRLAFRLADINVSQSGTENAAGGMGGPLIDAKDPKALAVLLDVDEPFATQIQHAVADLSDMRALDRAAEKLPLSRPAFGVPQTSGFGYRADPFTGRSALHNGLDFAGPFLTPIYATAPGIVSFTGQRTGYGNVVEIDHGGGFKTRYAHLAAYSVQVGQRVAVGQRIASMGSTGRSTGPHVHYEIWANGKARNPIYFVRAGDYVQQK